MTWGVTHNRTRCLPLHRVACCTIWCYHIALASVNKRMHRRMPTVDAAKRVHARAGPFPQPTTGKQREIQETVRKIQLLYCISQLRHITIY